MCWLFYKPAAVEIPEDLLKVAYTRNDDGFGLMYYENGEAHTHKILPKSFDDVLALYNQHKHRELAGHFRMRTSGAVTLDMVHPFSVISKASGAKHDVWMMHNGVLSGVETSNTHSDTYFLAKDHIAPMLNLNLELLDTPAFQALIADFIGTNNKLLFLDDRGKFTRIHKPRADCVTFANGFWCSNTYAISGQYALGYDLATKKSFEKEQVSAPFQKRYTWDDEDLAGWYSDSPKRNGAYYGGHSWQRTPSTQPSSSGTTETSTSGASSPSAATIVVVSPRCEINSVNFETTTSKDGSVIYTPKPDDTKPVTGLVSIPEDVTVDDVLKLTNRQIWEFCLERPEDAADVLIELRDTFSDL